jgi:predicted dehydrogenase
MRIIRWGIIGCGNVTEVKSGPGFQQTIGSQLVAVMRRDGALAEDYAKRHGVPRWYTDAQQLIDDPEVDAVYIATPPNLHHPYTLAAARAGKPVYVEKPMALNMAECQEMIAVCRAAGVPLFVAYYRRALPRFVKAKELIENGAIGSVRHVQISLSQPSQSNIPSKLPWRFLPEIAGGGLFVDLASHTLDFLDFALGPIKSARGFARNQAGNYPAEDIVSAAFEFENGILGTGIWSFNSFKATDQISLVGSTGKITLSTFEDKPLILETHSGSQSFDLPHPTHIQQPLIEQIVAELQGTGHCVSTGESAIRTTQVMDQLLADYYRPSRSPKQTENNQK